MAESARMILRVVSATMIAVLAQNVSAQTIIVDDDLSSLVVRGVGADRMVGPSNPLVLDSASITQHLGSVLASPPDYGHLESFNGVQATAAPLSDFVTCEDPRREHDCRATRPAVFVIVDSAEQVGDTVHISATRLILQPSDARQMFRTLRAYLIVLKGDEVWTLIHPLRIRTG